MEMYYLVGLMKAWKWQLARKQKLGPIIGVDNLLDIFTHHAEH